MAYDPLDSESSDGVGKSDYDIALSGLLHREDGREVISEIVSRCGILTPNGDKTLHAFGCRLIDDVRRVAPEMTARILLDERK